MRIDNSPGAKLSQEMDAALYENSHYGIPTIGWEHEMEGLDRADAVAFYDRYYTPNNAIVVVAGDVTEDEVRALAESTYGKLAASRRAAAARAPHRARAACRPHRHAFRPARHPAFAFARLPDPFRGHRRTG